MPAFQKNTGAGATYAFICFIDGNGFAIGGSTTAPTAGNTSGALRLTGIKTASPTIPDPEYVQVTGDDSLISEFDFDSIAQRGFTADLAVQNLTLDALLQGSNVQTVGEISLGMLDIADADIPNAAVIIQSRAFKQDTGVAGNAGYSGVLLPLCTVRPLGRVAFTEREGAVYRLSITPQQAGYHPWGVTLLAANAGTTGARQMPFTAENPIHIQAFTGNNSTTEWNLDLTPISAAKTSIFINRVSDTTVSVNTTTKTATATSTAATSAKGVIVYEFTA